MKKITLTLILTVALTTVLSAQTTYYVDASLSTGNDDGSSWANAFYSAAQVQRAIDNAAANDIIKIASGSHTNGETTIQLDKTLTIEGGYDTSSDTRTGFTTLSGEDARRVMVIPSAITPTLSYLKIENGGSNEGSGVNITAAASPVFNNVEFNNNESTQHGGAVSCAANSDASPQFNNVVFSDNSATSNAGALRLTSGSSAVLKNVVFSGNSGTNGGAIFIAASSNLTISFTNTVFANNTGSRSGAIDCNLNGVNGGTMNLTNCTFYGNTGDSGAIYFGNKKPVANINNTVFYGNTNGDGTSNISANTAYLDNVTGSNVFAYEGTASAFGSKFTNYSKLSADPFVNSADPNGADDIFATFDDGLYPKSADALHNAGSDALTAESFDIVGQTRIVQTIDIGAYENQATLSVAALDSSAGVAIYPNPVKEILYTNVNVEKIEVYTT